MATSQLVLDEFPIINDPVESDAIYNPWGAELQRLPDSLPIDRFLTGSRAYGIPRADSDWDIVYRCSTQESAKLYAMSEHETKIVFGDRNIITCTTDWEFVRWAYGTHLLMSIAPVSRKFAVNLFEELGLRNKKPKGKHDDKTY
jgi:hypothetical protein